MSAPPDVPQGWSPVCDSLTVLGYGPVDNLLWPGATLD